jgi:hypothetical protein
MNMSVPLTLGQIPLMDQVTPHPPTMRGLKYVAQKLKSAGHVVVEWQGSFHVETTMELIGGFWGADGGTTSKSTHS